MSHDHVSWSDGTHGCHFRNLHCLTLTGFWQALTWIQKQFFFSPLCIKLLSLTSEYSLFSMLEINCKVRLRCEGEGPSTVHCGWHLALWILCVKQTKVLPLTDWHTSHLVSFTLILHCFVWWVSVFNWQPTFATAKNHFCTVAQLRLTADIFHQLQLQRDE